MSAETVKLCGLPDTVGFSADGCALRILDQTLLPGETAFLELSRPGDIYEAIKSLRVRGAPAIGVAAAIGLYCVALRFGETETAPFIIKLHEAADYLNSSRPTAVNLSWALREMTSAVDSNASVEANLLLLRVCAEQLRDADIAACRAIGEYGLTLLHDGAGVLTHCNAGHLATTRYGTALAPIHVGRERGMNFRVFCDETRPLLQGARLSAYELCADGVDTTVICDNMASQVMKNGWVDAVIVGADRIAANGDAANKIGTSGVAILAKHYGIPFYVAAPYSTIDLSTATGGEIVIEQREPTEVAELWYARRMAPEGVGIYNPAFDVTDASLITAIITDRGIIRPSYTENLAHVFNRG
jgi:S-methyl-5-thioribose-1-phosphate isomerase